jgi:hypothetical protein
VNLYGMGFHYQQCGTGSLSYGPAACLATCKSFAETSHRRR